MRIQSVRKIGLCAAACLWLAGSASAAQWQVPGVGVMILPQGTEAVEKMPTSAAEGRLEMRLHRHGIYGSEYYLLRGQNESDFAYAWAALIPLDAAFVETVRVPVRSSAAVTVNPAAGVPLPALTVKKTVRNVPTDRHERMTRAAALVQKLWGKDMPASIAWTPADKKGTALQASWTRPLEVQGVPMPQQYRAWLLDRESTVELFLLVTDAHHPAWTESLVDAWQQRRESRSRYLMSER